MTRKKVKRRHKPPSHATQRDPTTNLTTQQTSQDYGLSIDVQKHLWGRWREQNKRVLKTCSRATMSRGRGELHARKTLHGPAKRPLVEVGGNSIIFLVHPVRKAFGKWVCGSERVSSTYFNERTRERSQMLGVGYMHDGGVTANSTVTRYDMFQIKEDP